MKKSSTQTTLGIHGLLLSAIPAFGLNLEDVMSVPEWISINPVGTSMQVNGLPSQIYRINSRFNSEKTSRQLEQGLDQSTINPAFPVNHTSWDDHILISQFRPPEFITIELIQSDFSTQGTLLVSDLHAINTNWQTDGFPLSTMNSLLLTSRIMDKRPHSTSETFTLNATSDFRSSYQRLSVQAIHDQWQMSEYRDQPEKSCQIGFFTRPTEKLFLSSCKHLTSGSQINVVWEYY